MRLSQIKLAGFKSFVDPTHIHLPGQIVGVVGPNGCGKSNVIDALRWVLGESRASALRGDSMQDVIFNGSAKRKPVARASVELVFDNQLGRAAGQWSDYAEICIKRVLLRNGESSYHINNQKVRRRDITDIFLGTGLGARAYAIVEQGMISRIIEAKPEELRVFLEEAAGVSRYRDRRRETSQRLGETRDNLLRIDDILQEMDKQLLHLGEQAIVALQYRELELLRDTTQQLLWLVRRQEAEVLRAGFAAQVEKTRTELEVQTSALREIESRLETKRGSHYLYADALHARQGELYSANAEIARLEQEIKHAAQQQLRLTQQIEGALRQIGQQQQQHQSAHSQLEDWQRQQEEAAVKLLEAEQQAELESVSLPQAEEAARCARQHCNGLQQKQSQLQMQLQLLLTQHGNLLRNIGQMEARRARLLQEQESLPQPDSHAMQQAEEASAELEMAHAEQDEKLALLQAQLLQVDQQRPRLRTLLQQQERLSALTSARLHALQQLQRQLDNDKHLGGWLVLHKLEGLPRLWQSIRIASGWENALEAVLHERLNALALPDLGAVAGWHDAPPARVALFEPGSPEPVAAGRWTPLLDYVACQDERVFPAMREWLALVYVVSDVSTGLSQREQLPEGGYFVTPDGHLIGVHSVLFHAPDSQLHGVLARQSEIEQLEEQLIIENGSVDHCKRQLDEAEQNYRLIDVQILPLRNAVSELKQRQHGLQMQMLKLNQAHEHRAERGLQIAVEMQEVAQSLAVEQEHLCEIVLRMDSLREEVAVFHVQVIDAQREANSGEMALRDLRVRTQQVQYARQEAHFLALTCQNKVSDLRAHIQTLMDALMHAEQNLAQLQAELSGSTDDAATPLLQHALLVRQEAERALNDARNSLEGAAADLQTLEQTRISCEHQLGGLREQSGEFSLKEQEARLYFEQWAEKLQGVDESALLPRLASVKPNNLQNDLNRLNREIEALGAVNLAALDELQAVTVRKGYLDAQAQDLQQAMATLTDAIRHIDRESRELLMETFNQVNLQLAELFSILFAGGDARLVLTGEEILEGGVQVMAQPPGKKNSSIHLLSGGEKALTAIALIFSLFQLNPAPFCLLDEVDAPLDDTNTERLCALVRKMAQHTQFVFISHNKIAMEMAEQLIGVTMQEKGVSKVVSVDIEAALRMRDV
ncbi:MAG: chromosome segregation protein SMC [Proteobacteria bacterium]|nr:chromosome segregation protein SMC [Pseudomonadota bacterium]